VNSRFSDALRKRKTEGKVPVIPDIKRLSPKDGDLMKSRDPIEAARLLASLGAPALSVVTERLNFGGSPETLAKIVEATGLPVLRKDFIKDAEDLKITRNLGADSVLLICGTADDSLLASLFAEAIKIGLEPLVETHTASELEFARGLGATLVGRNNRDIRKLEADDGGVSLTESLSAKAPSGSFLISESGILGASDVRTAINVGADAVLVGTALWRAVDIRGFYSSMCEAAGPRV
jgi:indole-3-glycerol phosphate synthase